jgi:hypothetical protein
LTTQVEKYGPVPAGKHRKNSNKFPAGILLPLPGISGAFLQDPVSFPLLSCRTLRDPVAVIFELGTNVHSLKINKASIDHIKFKFF